MSVGRAFLATVGLAACGSGSATAFQPAGSLSPAPVQAQLPDQAGQRLARFRSDVSIDFTTPAQADLARRAVIDGYRNYALALWATVLSHGKNRACQRQARAATACGSSAASRSAGQRTQGVMCR